MDQILKDANAKVRKLAEAVEPAAKTWVPRVWMGSTIGNVETKVWSGEQIRQAAGSFEE